MSSQNTKRVIWLSISFIVIFLDQVSKWHMTQNVFFPKIFGGNGLDFFGWLVSETERLPYYSIPVTSFFNLVMAWNTGVSFSLFSNGGAHMPFILIGVALLIVILFTLWLWKEKNHFQGVCYALVIGGALGNVIDRARFGAVIDFLDFHIYGYHWPAFNVADMAVVSGIVVLIGGSLAFDLRKKWRYRAGMKNSFFPFILLTLIISGCGNVKNTLGLEKDSPDEFAVITRAPLEVPPHLILPPPVPGQPRPQEQAAIVQAQQAVLGNAKQHSSQASGAERALLKRTDAQNADPSIRATVNNETQALAERNLPVAKKLINIGNKIEPSATVVDAKAELERLKKNKENGKPVTQGDTPFIEE